LDIDIDINHTMTQEEQQELEKLRAFKALVHKKLDEIGVPYNPEKKSGGTCRVGSRLDILIEEFFKQGELLSRVPEMLHDPHPHELHFASKQWLNDYWKLANETQIERIRVERLTPEKPVE
jgi:hypothetical protein